MNAVPLSFPQTRADSPRPRQRPQPVDPRAIQMAETMRELLFRDGHVTGEALLGEGYTTAELIEHAPEAQRLAGAVLAIGGRQADRLPDVTEKALVACAGAMPRMPGADDVAAMRPAWQAYCTSAAAHRLDPWISQSERCLFRLKAFLDHLPLLPRERNGVVQSVATSLKKRTRPREA